MKYSNKKFYFQWLGIAIIITLVCVSFGFYVTHLLTSKEKKNQEELWKARQEGKIFGPLRQRIEIMRDLIGTKRFTPEESYSIVDKAHEAPFPEASLLLDENGRVLLSHRSKFYQDGVIDDFKDFKLSPNRTYRIYHEHRGRMGPKGPPKELVFIGLAALGVSIVLGIGLSLILLTWAMRRKAQVAEDVMNKIKAGELHTRFPITQQDEAGLLMLKFNDMATQIEGLVKNLKSTEESRTKLLQELAHDLRTPVASMKSIQEILFQKGDELEHGEKIRLQNLAQREVSYFERLVEDLLFLSGVNDPRYTQLFQKLNLTELIEEEIGVFDVGRVNIQFHSRSPVFLKGDPHLLQRLLKNALSNAVRHADSEVLLELEASNDHVVLKVLDDGPGFKEIDLATFGEKKYSRVLDEKNQNISVGLGSVIMKKIMSLHGGSLTVSNRNKGAELKLEFSW